MKLSDDTQAPEELEEQDEGGLCDDDDDDEDDDGEDDEDEEDEDLLGGDEDEDDGGEAPADVVRTSGTGAAAPAEQAPRRRGPGRPRKNEEPAASNGMSRAEKVKLMAACEAALGEVRALEKRLEATKKSLSNRVKELYQGCGRGPFRRGGTDYLIVIRGDSYSLRTTSIAESLDE